MTFVVEKNKTADPAEVSLFGAQAHPKHPQPAADLFEKFGWRGCRHGWEDA